MKKLKRLSSTALGLLIAAFGLAGCGAPEPEPTSPYDEAPEADIGTDESRWASCWVASEVAQRTITSAEMLVFGPTACGKACAAKLITVDTPTGRVVRCNYACDDDEACELECAKTYLEEELANGAADENAVSERLTAYADEVEQCRSDCCTGCKDSCDYNYPAGSERKSCRSSCEM